MNVLFSNARVFLVRLGCLFLFVVALSNQAFGLSEDVKKAIRIHYLNGDVAIAERMLKRVVADTNRTEGDDRQYALIYLGLIELLYNNTTQADNYLCHLLSLKPDFEPDFYRDITEAFIQRFSQLKSQKLCLSVEEYDEVVKKAIADRNWTFAESLLDKWEKLLPPDSLHGEVKKLKRELDELKKIDKSLKKAMKDRDWVVAESLLNKWEKLLPPDSPQQNEVKKLRKTVSVLKKNIALSRENLTSPAINQPNTTTVPEQVPESTCKGVIFKFHVKPLLQQGQKLFQKGCITNCQGEKETALTYYQNAQKSCPDHPDVQKGFQNMEDFYVNLANRALEKNRPDKVRRYLESLKKVNPQSSAIADIEHRL